MNLIKLALTIDKSLEMLQSGLKFNGIYVAMHCFLVYNVFKDTALVTYIWSCSDGRSASRSQLTRNWWWYVSSLTSARMHSRMSWSLLFLNYIFLVTTLFNNHQQWRNRRKALHIIIIHQTIMKKVGTKQGNYICSFLGT